MGDLSQGNIWLTVRLFTRVFSRKWLVDSIGSTLLRRYPITPFWAPLGNSVGIKQMTKKVRLTNKLVLLELHQKLTSIPKPVKAAASRLPKTLPQNRAGPKTSSPWESTAK